MTSLSSLKTLAEKANEKFGGFHNYIRVSEMHAALSPAFVLKMVAVVEAAAKLIDESPQDDKDRPYISDVCGGEFEALAKAFQQLSSASEDEERLYGARKE